MPKPITIDPGDRAMISQATGKPVSIDSQKKTTVPVVAMPTVQTASMPSTNSLSDQRQVAPQMFKPVARQAIPKMTSSRPVGLSASTGEETEATRDAFGLGLRQVDHQLKDGPTWESDAAEREGREERTKNYFDEQYEQGESGWDPLLPVAYGNTPQNDAYIRNAIENGLSKEDAYEIAHYDPSTLADIGRPGSHDAPLLASDAYGTSSYNGAPLYDLKTLREHGAGSEAVIDDGTSYDYGHMTSEWMTGPQYRKYVEMGMGGRDVNDIDMAQVYSKADEAQDYGFIPYVPNEVTYNRLAGGDIFRMPGEIGTEIANLRTSIAPDYSITYGRDDTTINGNEFDRRAPTFLNNYNYNIQHDPQALLDAPGSTIREYAVPGADGRTSYAHGSLTDYGYDDTLHLSFQDGTEMDVSKDEYDKWDRNEDGNLVVPEEYYRQHGGYEGSYDDTLYLTFSDGQTLGLPSDYVKNYTSDDGTIDIKAISDSLSSMVPTDKVNGSLPDNLDDLKYDIMPNLVMSDGTVIPYSDVERIYWDETAGNDEDQLDSDGNVVSTDDDIRYDFSALGMNKPRRLMNQTPVDFDSGGLPIDTTDLFGDVVDWTLGSVPISIGAYLPWVYSASQATNAGYGIEPGSYNPETGTRGLSAGGWDENGNLRYGVQNAEGKIDRDLGDSTRMWNMAGNALVPLTEQLVGPVGEHIIPLEGVTKRIPFKTDTGRLIADTLVGYGAEGVEEDLGNIFDELMQYGLSGAFANPVTGKDGETIKDIYGHEVRDADTGAAQRVGRFFDPNDLANAFLGGALVSPAMGLATTPMNSQSFLRNIVPAVSRDMARRQTGVDRYVETDLEREVREALEEGRIPDVPAPRTVSPEYASRFENVRSER